MKRSFTVIEVIIVLFVLSVIPISIWTDRTLDFWCTHFAHHPVNCPWWLSFIVTVVGNGVVLLANCVSEIVRLCM